MKKWLDTLQAMLSSVKGWMLVMLMQFLSIGHVKVALWMLLTAFMLDFVTGVWASYEEYKKAVRPNNVYFIESSKLRLSIVKAVFYMLFIFLSWLIYTGFYDGTFTLPGSSKNLTIIEVTTGLCVAIEVHSVNENGKRLGFDFYGWLMAIARKFWMLINTFRNG